MGSFNPAACCGRPAGNSGTEQPVAATTTGETGKQVAPKPEVYTQLAPIRSY